MTAEQWKKIEAIVQSALDIGGGDGKEERARFVAEACGEDAELRRAVERLIAAADDADASFIESPAWTTGALPLDSDIRRNVRDSLDEKFENDVAFEAAGDLIGKKIDVYELKEELGRGGMGAVFLAERVDGEFRQRVAIKLIKRGMDTDFIVKRFRHERQILAALEHPFVARLIGGGTSAEEGLPYFVMEYVEGERLYSFCDRRRLGVNERLRLFLKICEAVESAHRIRVVHRDLKPSNILVKADGTPKLLDFGIAKILDAELASATLEPTATAMRLMTPEYASPEQVCGEPVSPASDIYSLGVMLYELLTGHRPYRLKNWSLYEIHRAVCEEQPSVPSESLTGVDNLMPTAEEAMNGEEATRIAATLNAVLRARSTDFENLRRELAGNLDKIVLKTLRKKPAERYESAASLAADIMAYLENRPVAAASFAPEERKKSHVSAASAAAAPRVTGEAKKSIAILPFKMFGTNTGGAAGKDTDSDEFLGIGLADALVTRLSAIKQIVVRPTSSVLALAVPVDPFRAGRDLTVDFVVDGSIRRGGARIRASVQLLSVEDNSIVWGQTFDEKFTDILEVEDSISRRIAESLLTQLTGEEKTQLNKRGTDSPAAYEAYMRGRFYWNQFTPESLPKALESYQKAIELDPGYALPFVAVTEFYNWANIYGLIPSLAAQTEAERAVLRAIEINPQMGEAYASLGLVVQNRFEWAEAEKLKLEAIRLTPNYPMAHEVWSAQLVGTGRTEEGVQAILRHESLEPLSLRGKTLTAWVHYQAHRFGEALTLARQMLELDKNYSQGYMQSGAALWGLKRYGEALRNFQKFDEMTFDLALSKYLLCFGLVGVNRNEEARAIYRELEKLAASGYVKPYFLAMANVAIGDKDRAFEFFEQSFNEQEPWLIWLGTDPMLESLHDDWRYINLLERMNNPIVARFRKN